MIIVSNGTYSTGARLVDRTSNRVTVLKPLRIESVNGPAVTTIEGYQVPGTTNSPAAVRCIFLTNNAFLGGFTLTKGATLDGGGGVICPFSWSQPSGVVSNC